MTTIEVNPKHIDSRPSCFNIDGHKQFHKVIIGKQFFPVEGEKSVRYFEHVAWINNDGEMIIDPKNGTISEVVSWVYLSKGLIRMINAKGSAQSFPKGGYMSHGYTL